MMTELFLENKHSRYWEMRNGLFVKRSETLHGAGLRQHATNDVMVTYQCGPFHQILPLARQHGLKGLGDCDFVANDALQPEIDEATSAYVQKLYSLFSKSDLIDPEISLSSCVQRIRVVSPQRTDPAEDIRQSSRLLIRVIAQVEKRQLVHLDVVSPSIPPDPDENRMWSIFNDFRSRALEKLRATLNPIQNMQTYILSPGEVGILFHEMGHTFEGDLPRIEGWLGRKVSAEAVTLIDDPLWPNLPGSMKIDDEGNPCTTTHLIQDGYLVSLAHSSDSAKNSGPQTAHARRESYRNLPLPRLSNTYLAPGKNSPAEILSDTDQGVYVVEIANCALEPRSRRISSTISLGYRIEDGEITTTPCTGSFNFRVRHFLEAIDCVGNDLALIAGKGLCGKQNQFVSVGYGQPTVRVSGIKPD